MVHFSKLLNSLCNQNKSLSKPQKGTFLFLYDKISGLMNFEGSGKNVAIALKFSYKNMLDMHNMSTARNKYAMNTFANLLNKEILFLLQK